MIPSAARPIGAASVLASFTAWVVLANIAVAAEAPPTKYLLRYKFAMGETLRYEVNHATNVRTTMEASTQQAETQSDSVKAWKVTDVLPTGEMEFIHLVERVRMSNQTPERPAIVYDSRTDKKPPRGFDQAARAVGVPLSLIRISPEGAITHREEKHPQPAVTPDMPITLHLPRDPVAVGDKWDDQYDIPAERKSGAKIQVRTRRVCELREVSAGIAVIAVEYQVLTPVDPYVRSQLVDRIAKGTVHFDVERGRVVKQIHDVDARVLGFAGKASSMHFISRLQEKLLKPEPALPQVQQASAVEPK
jgi:hypothetical protein